MIIRWLYRYHRRRAIRQEMYVVRVLFGVAIQLDQAGYPEAGAKFRWAGQREMLKIQERWPRI